MKITISILLLFVCFGCKIRENKASSTYKAKSITVNGKGTIGDMYNDDTVPISTFKINNSLANKRIKIKR